MKLIAHDIFSLGLGTYVLVRLGAWIAASVILALLLSIAVNRVIDAGHYQKNGHPTRSYLTHSIFTAPVFGAGAGAAFAVVAHLAFHVDLLVLSVIVGIIAAYSHLLLDSLTEGGVFLWKGRIALAHFKYNNGLANGLAIMVGVLLLAAAVLS